ncbi:MAG: hypothetical protein R3C15_00275 [Thermoleophilia bacterium]
MRPLADTSARAGARALPRRLRSAGALGALAIGLAVAPPHAAAATPPTGASLSRQATAAERHARDVLRAWRCVNAARGELGWRRLRMPERVWATTAARWAGRCDATERLVRRANRQPLLALRVVFSGRGDGRHAYATSAERQAIRVAWCESRWDPRTRSGQYVGLLQLGSSERAQYGVGPYRSRDSGTAARATNLEQARSGYRMFRAAGRSWSRWQCRPGPGGPTSYHLGW